MPNNPFSPVSQAGHQSRDKILERASLALRARRFAEAEQLANDVLKASRTDNAAISILAHALIAQNRGSEAIAPLQKAARRNADAAIETLLGAALGGAKRHAEAIEQLRRATARLPPFPPAFQELAGQLAQSGAIEEAIAVMQSAVSSMPEIVDLQLDLARLHLRRNDRKNARGILETARGAARGRADILTELARVMLLEGDYAAAADTFRHALALHPENAMTRADLAACLLEMGERDAGEANLRSATRGRPQMFGRAVYALAMSSHGRFFLRPSAAAKFLQDK